MAKIVIALPHDRFRDEEYVEVREELERLGNTILVASNHLTNAHGHFGILVKPDILIHRLSTSDFDSLIFIGGRGVEEFLSDSGVTSLVQDCGYQNKILGAIGMAIEVLATSGVIAGKKVTCDSAGIEAVKACGGYYTGRLVEEDGNLVTGMGVKSTLEFAKSVSARLK